MVRTKKFNHLAAFAAAVAMLMSGMFASGRMTAFAEESSTSYKPTETGSITLDYYESDESHPVVGSEWRIYKVADMVSGVSSSDDGKHVVVNGLEIQPLAYQLKIDSTTTAEDVEKCLNYDVISESEIKFGSNKSITDGKDLTYFDGKTDSKGRIVFSGIPQGVYIGMETKAIRYHTRTVSFLVSVPGTDAQSTNKSSLDIHVEPKAVLAGDLTRLLFPIRKQRLSMTFRAEAPIRSKRTLKARLDIRQRMKTATARSRAVRLWLQRSITCLKLVINDISRFRQRRKQRLWKTLTQVR